MSTSDSASDYESSEEQILEIKENLEEECSGDFPLSVLEKISKKEAFLAAVNKKIEKLNFVKNHLEHEGSKMTETLRELNEYNVIMTEEQDKWNAPVDDAKMKVNFHLNEIRKFTAQKKTIDLKRACFSHYVKYIANYNESLSRTLSTFECNYQKEEESLTKEINEIEHELKMDKESSENLERLCEADERRVEVLKAKNEHLKARLEDRCDLTEKKTKRFVRNRTNDRACWEAHIAQPPTVKKEDNVIILRKRKEYLKARLEDRCDLTEKKTKRFVRNRTNDRACWEAHIAQPPTVKKEDNVIILRKRKGTW